MGLSESEESCVKKCSCMGGTMGLWPKFAHFFDPENVDHTEDQDKSESSHPDIARQFFDNTQYLSSQFITPTMGGWFYMQLMYVFMWVSFVFHIIFVTRLFFWSWHLERMLVQSSPELGNKPLSQLLQPFYIVFKGSTAQENALQENTKNATLQNDPASNNADIASAGGLSKSLAKFVNDVTEKISWNFSNFSGGSSGRGRYYTHAEMGAYALCRNTVLACAEKDFPGERDDFLRIENNAQIASNYEYLCVGPAWCAEPFCFIGGDLVLASNIMECVCVNPAQENLVTAFGSDTAFGSGHVQTLGSDLNQQAGFGTSFNDLSNFTHGTTTTSSTVIPKHQELVIMHSLEHYEVAEPESRHFKKADVDGHISTEFKFTNSSDSQGLGTLGPRFVVERQALPEVDTDDLSAKLKQYGRNDKGTILFSLIVRMVPN